MRVGTPVINLISDFHLKIDVLLFAASVIPGQSPGRGPFNLSVVIPYMALIPTRDTPSVPYHKKNVPYSFLSDVGTYIMQSLCVRTKEHYTGTYISPFKYYSTIGHLDDIPEDFQEWGIGYIQQAYIQKLCVQLSCTTVYRICAISRKQSNIHLLQRNVF